MSPREIVEQAIWETLAFAGRVAPDLADDMELGGPVLDLTHRQRLAIVRAIEIVIDGHESTRLGEAWHARTVGEFVGATARAVGAVPCPACGERLPAWGPCIYCEAMPRRAA